MWWTRISGPIVSVKRISMTPSTSERRRFIVIGVRTLRRGRAVTVDEDERLAFRRVEVKVQRFGPRADLVRRHVQGDEDNAFPGAEVFSDPRDEILELPDAGRAAEEHRVVRGQSVLHSGHLGPGFRSSARRRRLMHRAARCSVLSYIGRAVVLRAENPRATGRETGLRAATKTYNETVPCGAGCLPPRRSSVTSKRKSCWPSGSG